MFRTGVLQESIVVIERERKRLTLLVEDREVVVRDCVRGLRPHSAHKDFFGLLRAMVRLLDESPATGAASCFAGGAGAVCGCGPKAPA